MEKIQIGKNSFHLSFISISYRKRGYDPRTHNSRIVIIIKINHEGILFKE